MRYIGFLDIFPFRGQSQQRAGAFTLVELLLIIAILGTLGAIAVPTYNDYIDRARNATAMADIVETGLVIVRFQAEHGGLPNTLVQAGVQTLLDPWGRPYRYTVIQGLSKPEMDAKSRWDKNEKPLNHDFDLYSMGKDGKTKPKITDKDSYDDIIRAHGGTYVGLASEY
jgi:general secretion pathway protein G